MLDADDVYLIDAGSVVFVWIGKKASATERKEGVPAAMVCNTKPSASGSQGVTNCSRCRLRVFAPVNNAGRCAALDVVPQAYIEREGKPCHTKVLRIPHNGETPMFKSVFYQWDPPKVMDFGHQASTGVARVGANPVMNRHRKRARNMCTV